MRNKIKLIGTVHIDTLGPERLQRELESLEPDVVGIEFSEKRLQSILKRRSDASSSFYSSLRELENKVSSRLMEAIVPYNLKLQESYMFEYDTSKKYCDDNKIPLELIDAEYPGDLGTLSRGYDDMSKNALAVTYNEIPALESLVKDDTSLFARLCQISVDNLYSQMDLKQFLYNMDPFSPKMQELIKNSETAEHDPRLSKDGLEVNQFAFSPHRNDYMAEKITCLNKKHERKTLAFVMGGNHLLPVGHRIRHLQPHSYALPGYRETLNSLMEAENKGLFERISKALDSSPKSL